MSILYLTTEPIIPTDSGSRLRSYNLIKQLASHHVVHQAYIWPQQLDKTSQSNLTKLLGKQSQQLWIPQATPLSGLTAWQRARYLLRAVWQNSFPLSLYYQDSRVAAQVGQFLATEAGQAVDTLIFQSSYLLPAIAQLRRQHPQLKIIMDAHNIESLLQQRILQSSPQTLWRPLKQRVIDNLKRQEQQAHRWVDGIAAVSPQEVQWWQQHNTDTPVALVSNGVDTDLFKPGRSLPGTPTIAFVGSMSYQPNEQAVLWFYQQVWPILSAQNPQLQWLIIGKDPSPAIQRIATDNSGSITVTGTVHDVRIWLKQAKLVIAPLLSGGGTRLKILEAMALGRVVVSTIIGAEGLIETAGLIREDQPQAMAQAILDQLANPQLKELGQQNRQIVIQHYGWPAIGQQFQQFLQQISKNGHTEDS